MVFVEKAQEVAPALSPHILILEDRESDAELLVDELKLAGFVPEWQRVETQAEYVAHLDSTLDLIFADYTLPNFDALKALHLLQESGLDIPFIVVSGSIGEDLAVQAMKLGASDYMLKDRLARLGEAVKQALQQKKLREARKQTERDLRLSEIAEREQRALAEALRDSTTALISSLEPRVVMKRILDNLGRVVPHHAANIMLIKGDAAQVEYWLGYDVPNNRYLPTAHLPLEQSDLREMLTTRAPILIADTQAYPGWPNLPEYAWIHSHLGAPILAHEQVIGFLNIDSSERGYFTQRHAETLKAFADQAAIAIENAQLYDQLRRHATQLEERVAQRTAELLLEKDRAEAILNSSNDAIAVTDLNGIIVTRNPSFKRIFGYQIGEAVGRHLAILAAPDDNGTLLDALHEVITSAQPGRVEIGAVRKDGSVFDCDLVLSPIVAPDGNTSGVVCGLRDISDHKRLETGLLQALEQEKDLNELKSRFVSMTSHEFRSPLSTILTSSSLLENNVMQMTDEQRQKHFRKIEQAVRRMTQLMDDVLTYGKGGAGRIEFEPERLDLVALCQEFIEEVRNATGETHQVEFSHQGRCSEVVMDESLVRQIVVNLLSNAIKYSPEHSQVKFNLTCEGDQATLRIQDTGIGIPESDRLHMFEPFHRAGNVKGIPGTGLGLAITWQAVVAHYGKIAVESALGVGTTFTVILPTRQGQ